MKLITTLLVLLLATPALAWDREGFKRDVAWLTAMNAADYLSTEYMLANCPGCFEANPFMREHREVKKAVGVLVAVGALYVARRLGGDQYASVVRWIIVGALLAVSGWNMHLSLK